MWQHQRYHCKSVPSLATYGAFEGVMEFRPRILHLDLPNYFLLWWQSPWDGVNGFWEGHLVTLMKHYESLHFVEY